MRIVPLALIALTISVVPAEARRAFPALPLAPRGVDYVESVCTGGIDGRYEVVRVLFNGQIQKMTRRSGGVLRATATRGEIARLSRSLDRARFDRRTVKSEPSTIADGINCSLNRRKAGRMHSVMLLQQTSARPEYRDLSDILKQVNVFGDRVVASTERPSIQ